MLFMLLTLILSELKVIIAFATSSIGIQSGQPAHPYSLTRLILSADQLQVLTLISLKLIMNSAKNRSWIILFKKLDRLKVKLSKAFIQNQTCNICFRLSHTACLKKFSLFQNSTVTQLYSFVDFFFHYLSDRNVKLLLPLPEHLVHVKDECNQI